MTKFETVGVNHQYNSSNTYEANKAFEHSCNCCCTKGIKLECNRCSIAFVHSLLVAHFSDKEKAK